MYKLKDWINSKYLNSKNIKDLILKMNNNYYLVFENFFKKDIIEKIQKDFLKNEKKVIAEENYLNGIAYVKGCKVDGEFLIEFKEFIESKVFLNYLSLFSGKKLDSHFEDDLSLEQIDYIKKEKGLIIQCFKNKHYMNWHDDLGNDLVYLFYLNIDWEKEDGGLLELGQLNSGQKITKFDFVIPKINTFVLLKPKNNFFHRVSKVKEGKERYGIVKFLEFI